MLYLRLQYHNFASMSSTPTDSNQVNDRVSDSPAVAPSSTTGTPNPREVWTQKFSSFQGDLSKIVLQPAERPLVRINRRGNQATRLVSICGHPIATIPLKGLQAFCKLAAVPSWTNKTKYAVCQTIVGFVTTMPAIQARVGTIPGAPAERGTQQQQQNGYFLLINCLFHPGVVGLYASYGKQPDKTVLDKGRKANQDLYEKLMQMYNAVAEKNKAKWGDLTSVLEESSNLDAEDKSDDEGHDVTKLHFLKLLANVNPKDVVPIKKWQEVSSMIAKIHKEFRVLCQQWKRSGEHRELDDSHEGMSLDIDESDDIPDSDIGNDKFEVANKRILYYFLFLRKSTRNHFALFHHGLQPCT